MTITACAVQLVMIIIIRSHWFLLIHVVSSFCQPVCILRTDDLSASIGGVAVNMIFSKNLGIRELRTSEAPKTNFVARFPIHKRRVTRWLLTLGQHTDRKSANKHSSKIRRPHSSTQWTKVYLSWGLGVKQVTVTCQARHSSTCIRWI